MDTRSKQISTDNSCLKLARMAFADTLDRLEILLQEARHAQENIIYCLREPMFSRALRFEEMMIWDNDISAAVFDAYMGFSADTWFKKGDSELIARQCTIVFPTLKNALGRIKIHEQPQLLAVRNTLESHKLWALTVNDVTERVKNVLLNDVSLKSERFVQKRLNDINEITNDSFDVLKIIKEVEKRTKARLNCDSIKFPSVKIRFFTHENKKLEEIVSTVTEEVLREIHDIHQAEVNRIVGVGLRVTLRAYYLWSTKRDKDSFGKDLEAWLTGEGGVYLDNLPKVLAPNIEKTQSPILLTSYQTACVLQLELAQLVFKVWTRGDWSDEQKRYYFNLIALQQIKRDIVRDRLLLVAEGWTCLAQSSDQVERSSVPRFLLLRSVLTARIENYIARLGDCQELFNKSQDTGMGLNEFPHPSGERRREQRLYDAYLTNRCVGTWDELSVLMQHFNIPVNNMPGHLQHRWAHEFRSNYIRYESSTDKHEMHRYRDKDKLPSRPRSLHFVNSSYYMPDRPDIQPLISHEVAHALLHEHFGPINAASLQTPGLFFNLLRSITRTIMETRDSRGELLLSYPSPQAMVEEIASDLLTGAVQGPAYLWALFLEILGRDLDDAFHAKINSEPDPALIDHISGFHFKAHQRGPWYLRLKTLCGWLRDINDSIRWKNRAIEINSIEDDLIGGVERIIDLLQIYLDEIGSQYVGTDGYSPESKQWIGLGRRLQRVISSSSLVERAAEWRGSFLEQAQKADEKTTPTPLLNRILETMRVREAPCVVRPLSKVARELIKNILKISNEKSTLWFCTARDVPWQLIFYLFGSDNDNQNPAVFSSNVINIYSRMRELHIYALEWDIATTDPIGSILEGLNQALCATIRSENRCPRLKCVNTNQSNKFLWEKLKDWIGCNYCPDVGHWLSLDTNNNNTGSQFVISKIIDIKIHIEASSERIIEIDSLPSLALRAAFFYSDSEAHGINMHHNKHHLAKLFKTKIDSLDKLLKSAHSSSLVTLKQYSKTILNYISSSSDDSFKSIKDAICKFSFSSAASGGKNMNLKTSGSSTSAIMSSESILGGDVMPPVALGRLCFAGIHRMLDPYARDEPTKKNAEKMKVFNNFGTRIWGPHCGFNLIEPPYWDNSVMGHYDRLIVATTNSSTRHAPRFHEANDSAQSSSARLIELLTESFLPYHTRWEWAIPLRLRPDDAVSVDTKHLAYISIVLTKPAGRMLFVQRLLDILSKTKCIDFSNDCARNRTMGELISSDDILWLCDSWQDIMLEIRGDIFRMSSVFSIKNILHDDPQVQSAEIVFSTNALDVLCCGKKILYDKFDVRMAFRTDRRLRGSNKKISKDIEKNSKKLITSNAKNSGIALVEIGRRLDYAYYFNSSKKHRHDMYRILKNDYGNHTLHSAMLNFFSKNVPGLDKFQTDLYGVKFEE